MIADSQRGRLLIPIMTISAFGPYLAAGIRTEQIVVYVAAACLLPFTWTRLNSTPSLRVVILAYVGLITIAGVGSFFPLLNRSGIAPGNALAVLDNFTLPLAVVLLTASEVNVANRVALLQRVTLLVTVAMCANAVLALAQILYPPSISLVTRWLSADGSETVAARALTLGRYTGVMNQPALAGVCYGVALLCALYWLRDRPRWLALAVGVLTLGGVLAVSKSFLLIGLPVAGWHLIRLSGARGRRVVSFGFVAAAAAVCSMLGYLDRWTGLKYLLNLLPSHGGDQLGVLTGNRYGAESATRPMTEAVLKDHPFTGYGMSGLDAPTDSAWLQVLVVAGLIGVAFLACIVVALWRGYLNRRWALDETERRLFAGVALIAVASSFGFPVFTGNRLGLLLAVLLTLLLSSKPQQGQHEGRRSDSRPVGVPDS
jgi:hypothetical protein